MSVLLVGCHNGIESFGSGCKLTHVVTKSEFSVFEDELGDREVFIGEYQEQII